MNDWFSTDDRCRHLLTVLSLWMGTPFAAYQCKPGAGVDCVQLAGAVYCQAGPITEFDPGPYNLDHGSHSDRSLVRAWLDDSPSFRILNNDAWGLGDILTFRVGRSEHHCGIMSVGDRFVHAIRDYGVIRSTLRDSTWSRRLTAVYRPIEP